MRTKKLFILLMLGIVTYGWAQQPQLASSITCHPDGKVTFTYKNETAKQVKIDVQFAGQ